MGYLTLRMTRVVYAHLAAEPFHDRYTCLSSQRT
jgi:hypothetical protein